MSTAFKSEKDIWPEAFLRHLKVHKFVQHGCVIFSLFSRKLTLIQLAWRILHHMLGPLFSLFLLLLSSLPFIVCLYKIVFLTFRTIARGNNRKYAQQIRDKGPNGSQEKILHVFSGKLLIKMCEQLTRFFHHQIKQKGLL